MFVSDNAELGIFFLFHSYPAFLYLSSLDPPLLPTIALAMKILPLIVPVHWRWLFIGLYAQSKRLQAVRIEHGDSGMAKRILGCDPRKTDVSQGSYRGKNKEVRATRRGRTDVSKRSGALSYEVLRGAHEPRFGNPPDYGGVYLSRT
jgi:hypothetical protein